MKTIIPEGPPNKCFLPNIEFSLSLIKEELKNLKSINDLNNAGIDASSGLLDFSKLILRAIGFDDNLPDEFYEWYFRRQNKLVEYIDKENDEEFHYQALNFYIDLVVKKKECEVS